MTFPSGISQLLGAHFEGRPVQHDILVGQRVRSYDFAGVENCYAEGTVEGVEPRQGCLRYRLRVERRVMNGRELARHEAVVYPPVNGTPTLFGTVTNLVERL